MIPSFSGTPTVIFKQGKQIEHEEGKLDSSLEDTEHRITYHDDSDNEQNEDEHAEEELSQESTGGDKEKRGKKRRLSPIKLPASHYVLSEAEKRRERNIQDRERQYQEWERKRALEEGQKTSDGILGLNMDDMD